MELLGVKPRLKSREHPKQAWYSAMYVAFLLDDVPAALGLTTAEELDLLRSLIRDTKTLVKRCTYEGESFLTTTLPALGSSLDLALEEGKLLCPTHFRKKARTQLPLFLNGLFKLIFNDDGTLLQQPHAVAIRVLRQLLFWGKKVKRNAPKRLRNEALEDFLQIEKGLPEDDVRFADDIISVAKALCHRLFRDWNPNSVKFGFRHGPGAVASAVKAPNKRAFLVKYDSIERIFRPIPTFFSLRDAAENVDVVLGRVRRAYPISRLTFVPKTVTKLRTIIIETAEAMWVQQAVKASLYSFLESHELTRGQINFEDQNVNRSKVLYPDEWDTTDQSSASDRNSFALVATLLEATSLWKYLVASRSPATLLPTGEILRLKKFAGMGSAVCFPIQALVYWALAVATLHRRLGLPLKVACKSVFVYGDDVIVPHGTAEKLMLAMSKYSLRFNMTKSYYKGRFRESCGLDAYDGVDVTPVRMSSMHSDLPHHVHQQPDPNTLSSVISHANNLAKAGYLEASRRLRGACWQRYPFTLCLPVTCDTDLPVLHFYDPSYAPHRVQTDGHGNSYIEGWVFKPKRLLCPNSLEAAYLRESLSTGGPVGRFFTSEGIRIRTMDARYIGNYRKRRLRCTIDKRNCYLPNEDT